MEGSKKKGLLVYDSIYGATTEVAYWIRDLIGAAHALEVKQLGQVTTVKPFDYIIIGSYTRREKPSKATYAFVKKHHQDLSQKEVCYFLTCGDCDETQLLKIPGSPVHLIGGRNYFRDILEKYPKIKPKVIGGFGGRQVYPTLHRIDRLTVDLVGKLAKESGAPWQGRDIWESLVPERVEAFAGEVREKILEIAPKTEILSCRRCWQSLLPAALENSEMVKQNPKLYTDRLNTGKVYFSRFRILGGLETAVQLVKKWAALSDRTISVEQKTYYNFYFQAMKSGGNKSVMIHITAALFPEDPGNVHVALRCYGKPAQRTEAEKEIDRAEDLFQDEGRRVA